MSEIIEKPCADYNAASGKIGTLVGNWAEERVLQAVTGASRCKLTAAPASASLQEGTIPAATSCRPALPTRPRVIDHTDQLSPSAWATHSQTNFQAPHQRTGLTCEHVPTGVKGPREQQELARLMAEAAVPPPQPPPLACYQTTNRDELVAHSLEGLQLGARVMKDRDGRPASRDVTFLAETKIMPRASADRLLRSQALSAGATASARLPDASVPITMYTEAAAAKGTAYMGTWGPGKGLTNARCDNFTKLMGDINKDASDC